MDDVVVTIGTHESNRLEQRIFCFTFLLIIMKTVPSVFANRSRFFVSAMFVLLFGAGFSACNLLNDPHDDDHHDDHDLITTVRVQMAAQASSFMAEYVWEDLDGIGGDNPSRIDTIVVETGKTYTGMLTLANKAKTPSVDMTAEIREDADEHQVFYTLSAGVGSAPGTITVTDRDGRNLPLGLNFSWSVAQGGAGLPATLKITLYHYDEKSDKNGTDPGNETDLEVVFPVVVR